jgi:hypothetical protein
MVGTNYHLPSKFTQEIAYSMLDPDWSQNHKSDVSALIPSSIGSMVAAKTR